jgi:hypothetical protein
MGGVMDYNEGLMIRHGMLRAMQGTADRSPLLAGNPEPPRADFDLNNWTPPPGGRLQ